MRNAQRGTTQLEGTLTTIVVSCTFVVRLLCSISSNEVRTGIVHKSPHVCEFKNPIKLFVP